MAIGWILDFEGDIMTPAARYDHGMREVRPFYQQFKQAIDQSRNKRQASKPDPTARGRVPSAAGGEPVNK